MPLSRLCRLLTLGLGVLRTVNDEQERILKESAYFRYPRICMEELRKNTNVPVKGSDLLVENQNWGFTNMKTDWSPLNRKVKRRRDIGGKGIKKEEK
jgi:hypothetical protein